MPISSTAVGHELPESRRSIAVRDALAYAAGIGDTSRQVFDDAAGVVAPPQFCVSLEWPVVSHPSARSALRAPAKELIRGVHASQDSHFFRPIEPGQTVVTLGQIVAIRQTRAGTLMTTKLETIGEDGTPLVTSWSGSMYRGVELAGDDSQIEEAPDVARPEVELTQSDGIFVAREMPHVYTECAQIYNPIHTERVVALEAGLPDIILHGTATWALAGREIIRRFADGDPRRLKRLAGRFKAMIIPGSEVEVKSGVVDREGEQLVSFEVLNDAGQPAIAGGLAVIS